MLAPGFGLIELVQMRLSPFIGICTMIIHGFPFRSKAFHNFRGVAVAADKADNVVDCSILVLFVVKSHGRLLKDMV